MHECMCVLKKVLTKTSGEWELIALECKYFFPTTLAHNCLTLLVSRAPFITHLCASESEKNKEETRSDSNFMKKKSRKYRSICDNEKQINSVLDSGRWDEWNRNNNEGWQRDFWRWCMCLRHWLYCRGMLELTVLHTLNIVVCNALLLLPLSYN